MKPKKRKSPDVKNSTLIITQNGVSMRLTYNRRELPKFTKVKVKKMLSEMVLGLAMKLENK